jgi:hypothetical protein
VIVDDVKCFDHFCNLKALVESVEKDEDLKYTSVNDK